MKKLLIFLHGFGFDRNNNQNEITQLAKSLGLDSYVSFDAPFPSNRARGGYSWYDYERSQINSDIESDPKFQQSIVYLKKEINTALQNAELEWKDLILCGRSQGALMSLSLGLASSEKCYAIVSLCGLMHSAHLDVKSQPPILWLEAGQETVLSDEHKLSYKKLIKMGCKLEHFIDPETTHDDISEKAVKTISCKLKEIKNG